MERLGRPRLISSTTTLPDMPLITNNSLDTIGVQLYQSYVGSISYLALGTRPDLSFVINYLSRFSKSPDSQHWAALEHLVCYILLMVGKHLVFWPKPTGLQLWVDADWGGVEFNQLTSGFIILLDGCPIAWASKRQKTVATSICNAEFISLGLAVKFFVPIHLMVANLGSPAKSTLYCDNHGAVLVAKDNGLRSKMRHISWNFFFVNDVIRSLKLEIQWVDTTEQLADTRRAETSCVL